MKGKSDKVLTYLDDISEAYGSLAKSQPEILAESYSEFEQQRDTLKSAFEKHELLVPVVGAFSAGKSTLINRTLGIDYLPVKITPETAIPTEIRYATKERVEAVRENGAVDEYSLDEMEELTARAQDYEYARLYANNDALKAFGAFVLVDMPGFNSPNDAHNKAILRYLRRGAYYLFLASVEEGGLHSQEMRRMGEVLDMERDFSIVLTKADLRPSSDVDEIKNFIEDQVQTSFGKTELVHVTGSDSVDTIRNAIDSLDADEINFALNREALLNLYFNVDGAINSAIDAVNNDEKENARVLKELRKSIEEVDQKREQSVARAKAKVGAEKSRHILSAVERELTSSMDELARAAATDQNNFGRLVSDIVRSTLTREVRSATEQWSTSLNSELQNSVELSVGGINLRDDWSQNMISTIKTQVMDALAGGVGTSAGKEQGSKGLGGKLAGMGVMLAMAIPHPVLKVVMAILPGIIGTIFDGVMERRKEEKIREEIIQRVIPDILLQIRMPVEESMVAISEQIAAVISDEFTSLLNEKAEAIEAFQKQNAMDSERRDEFLVQLQACKKLNNDNVNALIDKEAV